MVNGLLLIGAEALRRRAPQTDEDDDTRIAKQMRFPNAFFVGAAQALALIPGISRTGATMGGGLLVGLSHKDAARFAFLLATPIIGAAALLKLPELFGSTGDGVRGQALVASLCSARDRLPRGALPDALLRDADADPVRRLVPRLRRRLHARLRADVATYIR